jgi:hypothetical protein
MHFFVVTALLLFATADAVDVSCGERLMSALADVPPASSAQVGKTERGRGRGEGSDRGIFSRTSIYGGV